MPPSDRSVPTIEPWSAASVPVTALPAPRIASRRERPAPRSRWNLLLGTVRGDRRRGASSLRDVFVVQELRWEGPGMSTLLLSAAESDRPVPHFRPGQFAWLRLDGAWGQCQPTPFSVAPVDEIPGLLQLAVPHSGDVTSVMGALQPGRKVFVDGPYDAVDDVTPHQPGLLLIASATQLAPMLGILLTLAAHGDRRPVCLVIGAQTPDDLRFGDELAQLGTQLDLEVVEVVGTPDADWRGSIGTIDRALLEGVLTMRRDRPCEQAYVCLPRPLAEDVHASLVDLGMAPQHVRTEQLDLV
jgi:NAD(P)H-flavin reductase